MRRFASSFALCARQQLPKVDVPLFEELCALDVRKFYRRIGAELEEGTACGGIT